MGEVINRNEESTNNNQLDIHTMPAKFMVVKQDSKKAKIIGLMIIISVLTVVLIGAAFYLNQQLKKSKNTKLVNANINNQEKVNINTNQPTNNINQNINSSANVNNEINNNLNNNAQTNANINDNANFNPPLASILPGSLDSDNDSLTDEEEKIYGTDAQKPDTDGDGYLDGKELLNLYNPQGGGKLIDSKLVDTFTSPDYSYSIIYPIAWTLEVTEPTGREVMFSSPTGEFVKVFIQDNSQKLSALEWYSEQWQDLPMNQFRTVEINGWQGVWSLDELTIYLAKDDKLYIITYSVDEKKEVNFKTTFQVMVNSFKLKD